MPPFVAKVIDTTTQPLRTARQVFEGVLEETEEITFALKRTRKVTVNSEASDTELSGHSASTEPPFDTDTIRRLVAATPRQQGAPPGDRSRFPLVLVAAAHR